RGNDPAIQDELAAAYFRVGLITEVLQSPGDALQFFETAREMQERRLAEQPNDPTRLKSLGNTLVALGNARAKEKDYATARETFDEAVQVRKKLLAIEPTTIEYHRLLANTFMNIGLTEYSVALTAAGEAEMKRGLSKA